MSASSAAQRQRILVALCTRMDIIGAELAVCFGISGEHNVATLALTRVLTQGHKLPVRVKAVVRTFRGFACYRRQFAGQPPAVLVNTLFILGHCNNFIIIRRVNRSREIDNEYGNRARFLL